VVGGVWHTQTGCMIQSKTTQAKHDDRVQAKDETVEVEHCVKEQI